MSENGALSFGLVQGCPTFFFLTKGHKHYCGFLPEVGLKITVPGLHKGLNKTVMFIVYTHTHTHTHKQTESNPVITIPVYTTPRL